MEDKTHDAWALSLANFETLEDFLQADATRKTGHPENLKTVSMGAVNTDGGNENELSNIARYDENEDVELFIASSAPAAPLQQPVSAIPPASTVNAPPPRPPIVMPPHMNMNMMAPPPPHIVPPMMQHQHHPMAVMNMNMRMPPPPMMNMPPPQPQFAAPPIMAQQMQHPPNVNAPSEDSEQQVRLKVSDFPPLGDTANDNNVTITEDNDMNGDGNGKKVPRKESTAGSPSMTFHNPAASPVPTKLVSSSLMKPRDIQFVINSMLKSLTAENMDDYYYTQYLAKFRIVQRNGGDPTIVDQVKREKFRENIEQRSKEWQEKQQVGFADCLSLSFCVRHSLSM